MTVFRAATLRTFFFAFHAGAKELIDSVCIEVLFACNLNRFSFKSLQEFDK